MKVLPKRLSEFGVVKNPDVFRIQVRSHSLGITKLRQSPYQDDAVVTVKNSVNTIFVFVHQAFGFHILTPEIESIFRGYPDYD